MVEKAIHHAAQRWWLTLPDDVTVEQAQASGDAFCARVNDPRRRVIDDVRATIVEHAAVEPLRPAPLVPYPATLSEERVVSAQALVSWRGNRYSVAPQRAKSTVTVTQRLGEPFIDIATPGGVVVARHAVAPDGVGALVRTDSHASALETVVLGAFTTARPHRRKERIRAPVTRPTPPVNETQTRDTGS